ncbi:MAG: D-glycero-beta-D-manno-heptose 1-phosphate adenylyltransferase [Candidatus Electrothrix sp. AR4]|nr:D-glycero-beta-D-manno-heptose 1-phosphate adenylyltransferase [Candidatus Electrothrix sp. AR4]
MEENMFSRVACLQMEIQQGDVATNLCRFRELLTAEDFHEGTLIILPELWATGFDYASIDALADQTPEILAELQLRAAEEKIWFAGSLLEKGGEGKIYNTLFLVGAEGPIGRYQKHHMFTFWGEDQYLHAGKEPHALSTPFGPLGALVCYDLRFPEIARNQVFSGSKLVVVSAQWPSIRLDHWRILLRARALENQVFVVACNGCGTVGEEILAGHSMVVGPAGQVLAEAGEGGEVIRVDLAEAEIDALRSRFCSSGERPWSGWHRSKIIELPPLQERVTRIRRQNSRVVFTNGCFDLLHAGHVSYLETARSCGDCLVVAVNSDRSVQALKGPSRPVNTEQDRARVLAALGCVDFVVIFDEDTPHKLITTLLPDILVKGEDWSEEHIVGAAEVKAAGGEIKRVPFDCHVSTTEIIERIRTVPQG